MPKKNSLAISKKVLKAMEESITKQVIHKIGEIVSQKCREEFEKISLYDAINVIHVTGKKNLQLDTAILKDELKLLNDKADHMMGSWREIGNCIRGLLR